MDGRDGLPCERALLLSRFACRRAQKLSDSRFNRPNRRGKPVKKANRLRVPRVPRLGTLRQKRARWRSAQNFGGLEEFYRFNYLRAGLLGSHARQRTLPHHD